MEPLIFQALDWYVTDYDQVDEDDESIIKPQYLIKIFGRNNNGKHVSVNIKNYNPHFFIKGIDNFPNIENNTNINDTYHNTIINQLRDFIESKLNGKYKDSLIKCKILRKKDIWGFTNNKSFKFILLSFTNHKAMKIIINLLSKRITFGYHKNIKFKLYENNIEPYLRFIHKQDLQISGWIKIDKYNKTDEFMTKKGKTYEATWKNIKPYECNDIAPFIIGSFDIECNSYDGSFPCAIKTYEKFVHSIIDYYNSLSNDIKIEKQDKILKYILNSINNGSLNFKTKLDIKKVTELLHMHIEDIVSVLNGKLQFHNDVVKKKRINKITNYFGNDDEFNDNFTTLTSDEIVHKLVSKFSKIMPLLNGDPIIQIGTTFHKYGSKDCYKKVIITLDTCAELEGIKVIQCTTEKQVIIQWIDLINKSNPDIMTGYNILGFDYDYIYHRALELGCADYLCNLGKLVEPIKDCQYDDDNYCKTHWTKKTLSSSALGDNFLKYINSEGRIIVDLMKVIQSGHNLDTYKLDFVSQHFINGKITKIEEINDKLKLYIDNPIGIQKNNYLRINEIKYYIEDINYNEQYVIINNELDKKEGLKWGLAKDDVTPKDIFECQKGTKEDRAKVAKYCIQDCALCNYLIIKLEIIANNIGMSNVCSVPFSYIFLRGQGVKIFSLVAKQCKEDNFLIPYQDKKWKCERCGIKNSSFDDFCSDSDCLSPKPENEGYEGAIVLEPKPGIYIDQPVSVLDYASLYPSSMISENISHDTIILDEQYDNLPTYDYVDITYDLFKGKGDAKKKIGEQTCRYVQFKNDEKGLLPRILQKLLKARKSTRKKITWKTITLTNGDLIKGNIINKDDNITKIKVEDKEEKEIENSLIESCIDTHNEFQKAVLDGLQLAYKITANSLYGQVGAPTSPIFMKELAASTTATGRNLILSAKKFAEEKYNCEVIYGDSVVGYSPVIVKHNNDIYFEKMEDISSKFGGNKWNPCKEEGKQDKEACELNDLYSWTSKGWTKIHRIIRHKLGSHKKIIRVLTHTGCIDVTDDHSLLFKDGTKVSPKDLKIGEELLHKDLDFDYPKIDSKDIISVDEARIFGMFFGDGSCGYYNCNSGNKYSWAINNSDLELLNYYKNLCEKVYGHNFKINNTLESSNVYKLVSKGDTKSYVTKYRSLFYNNKNKIIPNKIFQSSIEVKQAFFQGIYDADGDKQLHKGKITSKRIDQKSMISAMYLYYLGISLGYNVSINTRKDKQQIFRIQYSKSKFRKNPHSIKKMYEIDYNGYVYDFTTDNHQFQSGVGTFIVSNTDSIFITLPKLKNYDHYGHPTKKQNILQYNVTVGEQLSEDFQKLLKPPHCLEWEKMFYPFIIFSKKRYVGNLYEHDVNKFKQKSMGIVLKRRDNANIVKIVYGGLINIILNEGDIKKSLKFLDESLNKLSEGKYDLKELIVTKTLRGFYKNPLQIAHKVLADRMKKRDPGSAPQSNDRVPYIYIQKKKNTNGVKLLQGDKIEDPKFIIENNLTPDYGHYITNQIMKPCLQLYSMILEELDGYKHKNDKMYWDKVYTNLFNQKKDKSKVQDKIKHDDYKMGLVVYKINIPY